jgi:lysophospholipase L1-like esterase
MVKPDLMRTTYITYISICIFMIVVGSCSNKSLSSDDFPGKTYMSYLALGDSYTIGESIDSASRWPYQLGNRLGKDGISFDDIQIIAKTGWTTDELLQGIGNSQQKEKYDLVSLLIGVNNQYRGRDIENFRREFRTLVSYALEKSGNRKERVFVLSIPDWGVTPFAEGRDRESISREIDMFNTVIKEECGALDIKYFDITWISRKAEVDLDLIAEDGLHPSAEMYSAWIEHIYDHVYRLF